VPRSPPLQDKGYPVIAVANPLRGLTTDAEYVRSVLQTIPGPIVMVGHSYGGAVISNAARGVSNVEALVCIAAFAPDTDETLEHLVTKNPGTHITPTRWTRGLTAARRWHRDRPVHQDRGLP
jgi:pimeloyl-ACP methyl ester carboxylesterase